jgi:hypothetical protein
VRGRAAQPSHIESFQSTENANDGPNLSHGAGGAGASGGVGHRRFNTRLSAGVEDIKRLYDRQGRQTAGVRAVCRDSDAAGRLGDSAWVVALSAAEERLIGGLARMTDI